ncbi:MAG: alpha-glucuronidase [Clostridiales bacterium]|nr:alpha-glucuronidase [Clostridiales bacterium]
MRSQSYSLTWLSFLDKSIPSDLSTPLDIAKHELSLGVSRLDISTPVSLEQADMPRDSYTIARSADGYSIQGGKRGVLYGVYQFLMNYAANQSIQVTGMQSPYYALRMLDCWDNADGSIERGYAGKSIFFDHDELCYDPNRIRQLGRMLASVGINVLCINNVNVSPVTQKLIEDEWLAQTAAVADLLRPFGVSLMLSIDYASPIYHDIHTADPLDAEVQAWWSDQVAALYALIPDFAGFLVKADSEHRPGPFTYGRNHAQGANMLARALKPFGGVLIWRCFVYDCKQDWRDTVTDRPKAAYEHYEYLDGEFDDNVILQIKHGPYDFQVREPISPLLFAMPKTNKAIELQLAQEYTGQQIDIYAMLGMWQELVHDLPSEKIMAIAAVANLGDDENWTGHEFAQLNLFAYGQLAWNPHMSPEDTTRLWCRLTFGFGQADEDMLISLLANSRHVYELYTAPLGLCWMVNPFCHYGPSPDGYEFALWGTYHRANRDAIGIDRTANGTGLILQYPEPLQSLYSDPAACPDELLLFFHRLPYHHVMRDGRTMIQRIYDDHFLGVEMAEAMADTLTKLPFPVAMRANIDTRMKRQIANAREWRDQINSFFFRYCGIPDQQGRTIYP